MAASPWMHARGLAPWLALLSTAPLSTALPAGRASAIVIDDFTVGSIVIDGPAQLDQTGLDPSHVLGGSRRFDVGQFGVGSHLEISADERLNFSSSGWGYFKLTYGGVEPLDDVDLTAGGHNRLRIQLGEIVSGFHPLGIYVNRSSSSSSNGVSVSLQDSWDGLTLDVPYAGFPVSFTAVNDIIIDVFRNPAGTSFAIESITTAAPSAPGDFNHDGVVDEDDLAVWQRYVGVNTRNGVYASFLAVADGNQDGVVDGAGFLLWQRSLAAAAPAGAPAPACIAVLARAGLALLRRVRKAPSGQ